MKVLTFNIWNIVFAKRIPERMAAIGRVLEAAARDPAGWDVVLLQELWSRKARAAFGDAGYPHVAEAERYGARPLGWLGAAFGLQVDSGLKILSKYPVLEVRRHIYSKRGRLTRAFTDGEVFARKSALAAKLDHPAWGPVWVIDTHLIAAYPDEPYTTRRKIQLMELHDFARELMKDAPVIVGGDLNVGPKVSEATPGNSYIPALWDDLLPRMFGDFARAADLDRTPTCSHLTCTWNDGTGEECHLDHILVGPGLRLESAAVTLDEAVDLAPGLTGHLSDHYGFEVTLARA
jgi:endonuclease/exonuclease/phosphatase family metal-dependent hydrolase